VRNVFRSEQTIFAACRSQRTRESRIQVGLFRQEAPSQFTQQEGCVRQLNRLSAHGEPIAEIDPLWKCQRFSILTLGLAEAISFFNAFKCS